MALTLLKELDSMAEAVTNAPPWYIYREEGRKKERERVEEKVMVLVIHVAELTESSINFTWSFASVRKSRAICRKYNAFLATFVR